MPRRGTLVLLATAAFVCAASGAHANERVLYLHEAGAPQQAPPGAIVPEPEPRPGDDSGRRAERALAHARDLFLASSFAEATEALRQAGEETAGDLILSHPELAVTLELWTGACAFLAHDPDHSRSAFRRALALNHATVLPEGTFPPDVEAFFARVQGEAAREGSGSTTIVTVPAGARLSIDGEAHCCTPVTLSLLPGEHTLRLERLGYERYTDRLDLGGQRLRETPPVVLQRAAGNDLRAQVSHPQGLLDEPDVPTLMALAREYGVDRVIYARRDGSTLAWPGESQRHGMALWPWIVGGSVAAAAIVGTVLYFVLRPSTELQIHTAF